MTGRLDVRPLEDNLSFGARIGGVTRESLADEAVRAELNRVFEERGMIVFEGLEPSARMHAELSDVFGPMKDHPSKAVPRVDQDAMPGVIDMACKAHEEGAIHVDGKTLISSQEFEDPESIENRGARFINWDLKPGEYVYPYECDPTFGLNYGNKK